MPYIATQYQGRNVEAARSSMPGQIDFDVISDPRQLQKSLADVRKLALVSLSEPLAMPNASPAIRQLKDMSVAPDGQIHLTQADIVGGVDSPDSHTVNMVWSIGLEGCPGTIDIASCAALGLRWRLSEDHPLVAQYPQLGQFEAPDAGPSHPRPYDRSYVSPRTLDRAMQRVTDTGIIEDELNRLIQSLRGFPLTTGHMESYHPEWRNLAKDGFQSLHLDAYRQAEERPPVPHSSSPIAQIAFMLNPNGLKIVAVSGVNYPEKLSSPADRDLAQAAMAVFRQEQLFLNSELRDYPL